MPSAMKASDIARRIESDMLKAFADFATNGKTARTQTALTAFGKLGDALGFGVQCKHSCYPNADVGKEWMYDQIWFVNHPTKHGFLTRLPMVLESEFSVSEPGIDDDFPKLVQARTDVRVWLCHSCDARSHIDQCKDQIREFCGSMPGDEWVFGVYDYLLREPLIERFTVTQSDLSRAGAEMAHV